MYSCSIYCWRFDMEILQYNICLEELYLILIHWNWLFHYYSDCWWAYSLIACVFSDQSGVQSPSALWVSDVGHSADYRQTIFSWKCHLGQVHEVHQKPLHDCSLIHWNPEHETILIYSNFTQYFIDLPTLVCNISMLNYALQKKQSAPPLQCNSYHPALYCTKRIALFCNLIVLTQYTRYIYTWY